MSAISSKRYVSELNNFIDRNVKVITVRGTIYEGKLIGLDQSNLSICLSDAISGEEKYPRVIIHGNAISEIILKEKPFDLKGLSDRLSKLFPNMVRYYEDAGFIMVMDRIKVTAEGVEGSGPMYERVKKVYDQYIIEQKGA
ncbi:MAG: Lsm family RNA-binding protein [Candidatus Methanomethyliaceae archaeon]|nr:Lsm family RNA-binding protein [Candidatus Methanomethyliaceae archaeon]MDW7971504.1 Lsm family RNA-binding protein [Nitrososphaerota archaeon]